MPESHRPFSHGFLASKSRISISSAWSVVFRFLALERVHAFDDEEDDERNNEKGQHGLDKRPVGNGRSGNCFSIHDRIGSQHPFLVVEIHPAGEQTDGRHDDVLHQRIDDGPKGPADDHADREVDHVPARDEFLELLGDAHGI
jgi:hypothetical protein